MERYVVFCDNRNGDAITFHALGVEGGRVLMECTRYGHRSLVGRCMVRTCTSRARFERVAARYAARPSMHLESGWVEA